MDEIDWIKTVKKVIVFITMISMGIVALVIIASSIGRILSNNPSWDQRDFDIMILLLMIGLVPTLILGLCYIILTIIEKILNSGRIVVNFNKEYIRDLPKHCSPAICSLIYDLKIDVYKDYTATVLYLCTHKYIELEKEDNTYKVKLGTQKDYSDLGRCEKYVLNIITNKMKFDANEFKQEIVKEAQEKQLITDRKHSKKTKIFLILIVSIILLIITYNISKIVFLILTSILGAILYAGYMMLKMKYENQIDINIVDTEYIRTEDGKKLAQLFKGLKRYIKEYTLIKDKEIDYIQILEDYIPYAISLDEADTVEEFIKHNEQYRDLIYNRNRKI